MQRITHCPAKRHPLVPAVHKRGYFFVECKGPLGSTLTYHKWNDEGFPFFTCPCGHTVCAACAEIGEFERPGAGSNGALCGAITMKIVQDSASARVQEAMASHLRLAAGGGGPSPFAALAAGYQLCSLAALGAKNIALWRACCGWRATHAQLAGLDDAGLRALTVAGASGDEPAKAVAVLLRGCLREGADGRLSVPPEAEFRDKLGAVAAALHAENDAGRRELWAGLASSAAGAAVGCTVA